MKRHLVRFILGAACLLVMLAHAGRLVHIPAISGLETYLYDIRVRLSLTSDVHRQVVVVDLDEKSLGEIGRWPWGRNVIADLARRLTDDYKVAVVGFDVVFAEADESSGLRVLEEIGHGQLKSEPGFQRALADLRGKLDYDQTFADTLKGRPIVLGYYFSGRENAHRAGMLPQPAMAATSLVGVANVPVAWEGYGANLARLQTSAAGAGHINPLVDADGSSRRVPMLAKFEDQYFEALSLAVVRTMLGGGRLQPGIPAGEKTVEWLELNAGPTNLRIPVDENLATLIPFRGPERSFPYFSAADVLKGRVPVEQLSGRIVLVGTTAPGLMDLRTTPVGAAYPGVEVHANLIAGMLDGSIKEKPAYVIGIEAVQLAVFGALLAMFLPLLSPTRATMLAGAALAVLVALNLWLWTAGNLVVPLASTILLIVFLYGLNMTWGYFVETRSKRQFAELFGQYVPPELVDEMAKSPESYSMEGRNEEMTVLFADIRGFTSISEGMDPKELARLMNEYLSAMTDLIRVNRGTLDKYIGDAIMAFWGAPIADPENARHAVLTALIMQKSLRLLATPFKARGWPELEIGIGINTGMMTVGDLGSKVRKAYTVIGDAVNLAARLEGITKVYGVGVIVGEQTKNRVIDVTFREIDRVKVQGKGEPVTIYEPIGLTADLSADVLEEAKLWARTLRLYRNRDWDQAELQLHNLKKATPTCRLYQIYTERVISFRNNPPDENWEGVTVFQTK